MAVGKDTHVPQNDPESVETAAARRLTDALAPSAIDALLADAKAAAFGPAFESARSRAVRAAISAADGVVSDIGFTLQAVKGTGWGWAEPGIGPPGPAHVSVLRAIGVLAAVDHGERLVVRLLGAAGEADADRCPAGDQPAPDSTQEAGQPRGRGLSPGGPAGDD